MHTLLNCVVGGAKSNVTNDTTYSSAVGGMVPGHTCVQPSEDSTSVSWDESSSEVIAEQLLSPCPQSSHNVLVPSAPSSVHESCKPVTPECELISKVHTPRVNRSTYDLLNTTDSMATADVS